MDRYTFYMLEFLEEVHPASQTNMNDLVSRISTLSNLFFHGVLQMLSVQVLFVLEVALWGGPFCHY